jgi:hypothetical protein
MRNAARSDERVAGRQAMAHSSREMQRHVALEHVEALLVRVMDVERRLVSRWTDHLDHAEVAVGLFTADAHAYESAEEPARLALDRELHGAHLARREAARVESA